MLDNLIQVNKPKLSKKQFDNQLNLFFLSSAKKIIPQTNNYNYLVSSLPAKITNLFLKQKTELMLYDFFLENKNYFFNLFNKNKYKVTANFFTNFKNEMNELIYFFIKDKIQNNQTLKQISSTNRFAILNQIKHQKIF